MQSILFWQEWPRKYQYLWYFWIALFLTSMLLLWVGYWQGHAGIIPWEKFYEQKSIDSNIHSFGIGPFRFEIPAQSFVIFEYFSGGDISPRPLFPYAFLVALGFSAAMLLALITALKRFWFIAGIILAIIFFTSLRIDVLHILDRNDSWPTTLVCLAVICLAALFHVFKPNTPLFTRFISFAALLLVMGLGIFLFSSTQVPFLHLAVTAYPAGMILALLFILLIAHEIIAGFVSIVGQQSGPSKNLKHFLALCLVYFINLTLVVLHEMDVIDWDFIYINIYLLLSVSAILGLWGFQQREVLYSSIIPFKPNGALFYIAFATLALAFIANLLGNYNDSALRIIRHVIVFSHLGFGFIFFIYLMANFIAVLGKGMAAYKVIYKPRVMPYFTFQSAGLIATLGMVFLMGWKEYIYHSLAGFYNSLGDLNLVLQDKEFAQNHFTTARNYGFANHHANYALARSKGSLFNFDEIHKYYDAANIRYPSEFSLINAGNSFLWEDEKFKAIKTLKKGLDDYPYSGYLKNNLGMAYYKVLHVDSALYFLNTSRKYSSTFNESEANFFGIVAKEFIPIKIDSVLQAFHTEYPLTIANALAVANIQHQPVTISLDLNRIKSLDQGKTVMLNNYVIHHMEDIDTTTLHNIYAIATDSLNIDVSKHLRASVAQAYYQHHQVYRALAILGELAYVDASHAGRYNHLMGLWSLEQGNPDQAARYFSYAEISNYPNAHLFKAMAMTESKDTEMLAAWKEIQSDSSHTNLASQIIKILTATRTQAFQFTDSEKYQYCRYRLTVKDTVFLDRLLPTFTHDTYKANALLDMAKSLLDWGQIDKASFYLNAIGGLQLTSKKLYEEVRYLELLIHYKKGDLTALVARINDGMEFNREHQLEALLYKTRLNEANGDLTNASMGYKMLGSLNPYFEDGIIAAARYFKSHSKDRLTAYSILSQAVRTNYNSIFLWEAYIKEASDLGFDEFALDARRELEELKALKLK